MTIHIKSTYHFLNLTLLTCMPSPSESPDATTRDYNNRREEEHWLFVAGVSFWYKTPLRWWLWKKQWNHSSKLTLASSSSFRRTDLPVNGVSSAYAMLKEDINANAPVKRNHKNDFLVVDERLPVVPLTDERFASTTRCLSSATGWWGDLNIEYYLKSECVSVFCLRKIENVSDPCTGTTTLLVNFAG